MKRLFILISLCLLFTCGFSQVKIGDNTTNLDGSAMLEVESTNQGLLPPRMTELQRDLIPSPANGLIIYCTDCCITGGELQIFDGIQWTNARRETACSTPPPPPPQPPPAPPQINQKNIAIWYFGRNAGLDFNAGAPVPLTDGLFFADEGGSVISDDNGDLLFYTDARTVWNKNHAVMETGLLGSSSKTTSQDGLIVKKPGSTTDYYIFTMQELGNSAIGFRYSEVDMTLNGGLGGVVPATKNTHLYIGNCENIAAVAHATENAIWLIAHKFFSNQFITYKITPSGINVNPKVQGIGLNVTAANYTAGQAKVSHDGNKYAVARLGTLKVEVYDFDRATADLSNLITITTTIFPYGIEFSPNNEILYVSGSNFVHQYNLLAGTETDIINSKTVLVAPPDGSGVGALQMGLDGKIYVAKVGRTALDVINNPDVLGLGANYVLGQQSLFGKTSRLSLAHSVRPVGP